MQVVGDGIWLVGSIGDECIKSDLYSISDLLVSQKLNDEYYSLGRCGSFRFGAQNMIGGIVCCAVWRDCSGEAVKRPLAMVAVPYEKLRHSRQENTVGSLAACHALLADRR